MQKRNRPFLLFTALCTLAYFVSYVSRINLAATLVEVVHSGFAPRQTVALALSINAVTYGAGQVVSGYLGDRFRPQRVMLGGFLLAGCMNLCVAFLRSPAWLVPLWAVNGFAQALMWPPLVRILFTHLRGDAYGLASRWVTWGSSLGTMAVYGFTPFLLRAFSFRAAFVVGGAAALSMAALWFFAYDRFFANCGLIAGEDTHVEPAAESHSPSTRPDLTACLMMAAAMVAMACQGALRDGVTTWLPTMVTESFQLSSGAAILTGVLLPIFSILSTQATALLNKHLVRNALLLAGLIYAVSVAAAALLSLLPGAGAALTVLLLAVLVGCMHGINFLFCCMVPPCFARYGHMSLVSGLINAFVYLGSALSTYGIAVFSQAQGWQATLVLWAGIAVLGTIVCLGVAGPWNRFTQDNL